MIEIKFITGLILIGIGFVLMTPIKETKTQQTTKYRPPIIVSRHTEKHTPETYAQSMVSEQEYEALFELIMLESNWKPDAKNPKSSAYGLGQLLDQTWTDVGIEKSDNFKIQLIATHKYVMERYGSWQKALAFRKRNGYY